MTSTNNDTDLKFMQLAIEVARLGSGKTFPKPSVGAVLVKNNIIISTAHTSIEGEHAEPQTIKLAGEKAIGATLYVSLEPCNHTGNTPPCTDAIIKAKIAKVVIANTDINPVASGGIKTLVDAGITVKQGFCSEKALEVNKGFFNIIEKKKPYLVVKVASSLDGKIALDDGTSKYISGVTARNYVQSLRNKMDGILVGVNTVINDDPELTCRLKGVEKSLPKIILDTNHRTPINSKLSRCRDEKVIIFSAREGESGNAEVIKTSTNKDNTYLNLNEVMQTLAARGFERVLVEGGGQVISSFIENNLIDELQVVYSPKVIGNGISFAENLRLSNIPKNQFELSYTRELGEDKLLVFKNKS